MTISNSNIYNNLFVTYEEYVAKQIKINRSLLLIRIESINTVHFTIDSIEVFFVAYSYYGL